MQKSNAAFVASLSLLLASALAPAPRAATKTLDFLRKIAGKHTVVGVHNDQKTGGVNYYTDRLRTITGKYPGLWSGDFSYDGRINTRWQMIYEAERQWNAGAMVNIMWHACPPTVAEPCSWDGNIKGDLSDAQWRDLITEGGNLNRVWKQRIDKIAPFLKYLEDRGVEVLWRPHHEMNQGNFWWGGRSGPTGTAALYRVTHDYMTKEKGFRNLAWTWDIQDLRFDWDGYHPGDAYFDVMALDMYQMGYTDSLYRSMLRLAGGKPIALGEVQKMPSPAALEKHPLYTFVLGWAYMTVNDNSAAALTSLFTDTRSLTRDEMPGWQNYTVSSREVLAHRMDGFELARMPGHLAVRVASGDRGLLRLAAADGRMAATAPLRDGTGSLATAGLKPGVYVLTLETEGGASIGSGWGSRRVVLP